MSWEAIENHLFDKYCVEGEDKELCKLQSEHDAEIRAKAIDEFAERLKTEYKPCEETDTEIYEKVCNRIDKIAEEMRGAI